ncbi:hypothetical protein KBD45_07760 [Candidatus Dojkabacteria bacterium]|jgi:hypothetical protein|nr:hypothetical protein [Candidatus Dojkabacteria bacterium]
MTTVINTPQPASDQSSGVGMIIGLVVLVVFGFMFFIYGIPAIRQMRVGAPQVNIPSSIDVNVKQTE